MYNVFKCSKCNMQFNDEKRLERHSNIHTKTELKGRKQRESRLPDFDKPDFSQVM